jgi:hypothetical protein
MKRNILVALLVLALLSAGLLTTHSLTGAETNRGNAVPIDRLPKELKLLDVKDFYLPLDEKPVGHIVTIIGHVAVLREETRQAYFAAEGDAIFQQDSFITLKDSRCRIKFTTQDVITMGEDSRITVKELIDDRKAKQKKSLFSMLRGKAMFYVVRLFKYKRTESAVQTPTAVCGVRGTQFGVEIKSSGRESANGKTIYLADASWAVFPYLAQTGSPGSETIVYFYDGAGELCNAAGECFPVKEGESGLVDVEGNVYVEVMDPEKGRLFIQDTEVTKPEPTDQPPADPGSGIREMYEEDLKTITKDPTQDLKEQRIDDGDGFERSTGVQEPSPGRQQPPTSP